LKKSVVKNFNINHYVVDKRVKGVTLAELTIKKFYEVVDILRHKTYN